MLEHDQADMVLTVLAYHLPCRAVRTVKSRSGESACARVCVLSKVASWRWGSLILGAAGVHTCSVVMCELTQATSRSEEWKVSDENPKAGK